MNLCIFPRSWTDDPGTYDAAVVNRSPVIRGVHLFVAAFGIPGNILVLVVILSSKDMRYVIWLFWIKGIGHLAVLDTRYRSSGCFG